MGNQQQPKTKNMYLATSNHATRTILISRSRNLLKNKKSFWLERPGPKRDADDAKRLKKFMDYKARQTKGGINLGAENPTWLKQPGDKVATSAVFGFASVGLIYTTFGYYNMANGTGKIE